MENNQMYQLTVWHYADEKMNSSYGYISYKKWCEMELKRLSKNGIYVEIKFKLNSFQKDRCRRQSCSLWIELPTQIKIKMIEHYENHNRTYLRKKLNAERPGL